jgi:hypothetical protein
LKPGHKKLKEKRRREMKKRFLVFLVLVFTVIMILSASGSATKPFEGQMVIVAVGSFMSTGWLR